MNHGDDGDDGDAAGYKYNPKTHRQAAAPAPAPAPELVAGVDWRDNLRIEAADAARAAAAIRHMSFPRFGLMGNRAVYYLP